jgi:hypothetical protein
MTSEAADLLSYELSNKSQSRSVGPYFQFNRNIRQLTFSAVQSMNSN